MCVLDECAAEPDAGDTVPSAAFTNHESGLAVADHWRAHGQATAANVLYASRGLLSVLLIWSIGHWFSNAEQKLGLKVLRWRLLGATLMLAAIVLVMTR
jgi:hypothetical protein